MRPERGKTEYQDEALNEAKILAEDTTVPANGEFSLEEILAEYGESRAQRLMADIDRAAQEELTDDQTGGAPEPVAPEPSAEPILPEPPKPAQKPEKQPKKEPDRKPELPEELPQDIPLPPKPIPMEKVVERTVSAVLESQEELLPDKPRRRGLFSRKRLEDTEQLYEPPKPEPEPEEEPEPIGPEEPLDEMATASRGDYQSLSRPLLPSVLLALLLTAPYLLEERGIVIPVFSEFWSGEPAVQTAYPLVILFLLCILCRSVFAYAVQNLFRRRCTGALLISLSVLSAAADCATRPVLTGRSQAVPYAAAACWGLVFALWGLARESRGKLDTYRAASLSSDPPYLVTDTPKGACKQAGCIEGFYTDTESVHGSLQWQSVLLPVILMGTIVFAGLASLGQGRKEDFLLCWSAILTASSSFALPLAWGLPYSRLAKQLQKDGCTIAGWAGAEAVSRKKAMILTDTDLFPPGTVKLNGIKVFGEELRHAVSYAASLVRASGSGLYRLFDDLVRSEAGEYYQPDDFSFYEEGGCSGVISGEHVLLGSASFMRKMDVRLPGNLNLHTGVYLAVDGQLAAVFAVKYSASENVDWALKILRRNHVTAILASRDANITPVLLKRKFTGNAKVEYPPLAARLALSEQEEGRGGRPRALLLREGLLPYAETVVGSRRLCAATRRSTAFSLLGSAAGTLLAFYLSFLGSFSLMSPMTMLAFLLLWTLPALLLGWAGRA
jgi:hypothetical protein